MFHQMRNWIVIAILALPAVSDAVEWHSPQGAKNLVGQEAMICGRVGSTRFSEDSRGSPTYINLGPAFPDHIFTIVIWGSDRATFSFPPEELSGVICVVGEVTSFRGVPQIIVASPYQISFGD